MKRQKPRAEVVTQSRSSGIDGIAVIYAGTEDDIMESLAFTWEKWKEVSGFACCRKTMMKLKFF
jgi:hypothetical protein